MKEITFISSLNTLLAEGGFEGYAFKVGWYNDLVSDPFKLPYSYDTFAVVVLSLPHMFEKTFLPFIRENFDQCNGTKLRDPMDECMRSYFSDIEKRLDVGSPIDITFDFDMNHNRRPKILMQTAGHVAGAAYYYRHDKTKSRSALGVAIHPKYGGWFAFRSVMVFSAIQNPQLVQVSPLNLLPEPAQQEQLLDAFVKDWRTFAYRDVIPVAAKYSERQIKYFATMPRDRFALLIHFLEEESREELSIATH